MDRPITVTWAANLLYASLVIGIIRVVFTVHKLPEQSGSVFGMWIIAGIVCWFMWFVINRIQKGKNWARITYLFTLLINLPFIRSTFFSSFKTQPVLSAVVLAQIIMQIVALALLFQKESTEWYKQIKNNSQPER